MSRRTWPAVEQLEKLCKGCGVERRRLRPALARAVDLVRALDERLDRGEPIGMDAPRGHRLADLEQLLGTALAGALGYCSETCCEIAEHERGQ